MPGVGLFGVRKKLLVNLGDAKKSRQFSFYLDSRLDTMDYFLAKTGVKEENPGD